ncbi:MAG: hypothetical protein WD738_21910 [Pirellulales bacterium]
MNRLLAIALMFSPIVAFGQEDPRLVIVSPLRAIGVADAELNLKVDRGEGNGADNASKINEKIRNREVRYPIILAGGDYDVEETIGADVRKSEWWVTGSGVGNDTNVNPSYWTASGQVGGTSSTRLYWNQRETAGVYSLDRVMARIDTVSVGMDKLTFAGTRRYNTNGVNTRLANDGEPTAWSATSIDTGEITINVDKDNRTYTRASGSYLTDGFAANDWVTFSGFTNNANNGAKQISAVTETVITVTSASAGILQHESGNGNERAIWSYPVGSFVTHEGEVWRVEGNSTPTAGNLEPGVSGWTQAGYRARIGIWHQSGLGRFAWASNIAYSANQLVHHNGSTWITNASTSAGEEPGVSSKWDLTTDYKVWPQSRQNGPLHLPSVTFHDMDIGILAGPHDKQGAGFDITPNGTNFTVADDNTAFGDTMRIGSAVFWTSVPVGIWVRTRQSVANQAHYLEGRSADPADWADPEKGGNAILWCEFGGDFDVDKVHVYNYRTMLRTGYMPGIYPVIIRSVKVDGGVTHLRLYEGEPAKALDGSTIVAIENASLFGSNVHNTINASTNAPISLWANNVAYSSGSVVAHNDSGWVANANTSAGEEPGVSSKWDPGPTLDREPVVKAGPGMLTLRGVHGLGGNGTKIRLTGRTTLGNPPQWASIVIVEDSMFSSAVTHPQEVIDDDSAGPYMLIWKNCGRRFGSGPDNRIEMFRDGHFISPNHHNMLLDADSTPAPPPWALPD